MKGIYLYHRLERAAPNALPGGRKPPKEPPEIFEIPPLTEILATDILEADIKFEQLTGVNPVKYKGATPPITVTVPTLKKSAEYADVLTVLLGSTHEGC